MLTWLNAWGTKIPKAQFPDIRNRLREWHEHNGNLFPPSDLSLLEAEDADLDLGGDLFDSLKTIMRGNDAGDARLKIVETASAKILFALRPRLFPAWDDRMRKKPLRGGPKYDGTGASYSRFAKDVRCELRQTAKLCSQLSFDIDDLPARLGRPAYTTPAQLMIELYLVAITRGANPPPFALIRL